MWNCDLVMEGAHASPIYSMATMGNLLYTSSNRSLKIWDIESMECISDIQAHSGPIKSITVIPEHKQLATACEKTIMLWDLISLTNIGSLKAHKDEIRVLEKGRGCLVSGGRSMANDSSLFVWDLRKNQPLHSLEKH